MYLDIVIIIIYKLLLSRLIKDHILQDLIKIIAVAFTGKSETASIQHAS